MAALVRRFAPDMPLHASTQMAVHSPAGAKLAEELGFSRVVLARELTREEIEAIVRDSVNRMFDFKLLHIGLNSRDEEDAREKGGSFAEMFNLPLIDLPTAFFAGTMMEIVKKPFLGEHGHIAVSTNYIDRAMAYFERRGYSFRPTEGERRDLVAAYFEQEIGGFAIHLRRSLDR